MFSVSSLYFDVLTSHSCLYYELTLPQFCWEQCSRKSFRAWSIQYYTYVESCSQERLDIYDLDQEFPKLARSLFRASPRQAATRPAHLSICRYGHWELEWPWFTVPVQWELREAAAWPAPLPTTPIGWERRTAIPADTQANKVPCSPPGAHPEQAANQAWELLI